MKYEEQPPDYKLVIDGRADGIITAPLTEIEDLSDSYEFPLLLETYDREAQVTIDEIKGTYRELDKIKKPEPVHLAQAKVYAYIYGKEKELKNICVRMTYCNMDT